MLLWRGMTTEALEGAASAAPRTADQLLRDAPWHHQHQGRQQQQRFVPEAGAPETAADRAAGGALWQQQQQPSSGTVHHAHTALSPVALQQLRAAARQQVAALQQQGHVPPARSPILSIGAAAAAAATPQAGSAAPPPRPALARGAAAQAPALHTKHFFAALQHSSVKGDLQQHLQKLQQSQPPAHAAAADAASHASLEARQQRGATLNPDAAVAAAPFAQHAAAAAAAAAASPYNSAAAAAATSGASGAAADPVQGAQGFQVQGRPPWQPSPDWLEAVQKEQAGYAPLYSPQQLCAVLLGLCALQQPHPLEPELPAPATATGAPHQQAAALEALLQRLRAAAAPVPGEHAPSHGLNGGNGNENGSPPEVLLRCYEPWLSSASTAPAAVNAAATAAHAAAASSSSGGGGGEAPTLITSFSSPQFRALMEHVQDPGLTAIAVDFEMGAGRLAMAQICAPVVSPAAPSAWAAHAPAPSPRTYLVDLRLGGHAAAALMMQHLRGPLTSATLTKVVHGAGMDQSYLQRLYGFQMSPVADTQLVYRLAQCTWARAHGVGRATLYGRRMGLDRVLAAVGLGDPGLKQVVKDMMNRDPRLWLHRPLSPQLLRYAAGDVEHLLPTYRALLRSILAEPLPHFLQQP